MKKNNFQVDFIGIGMPRCATTWIYECLQEHPEICMASEKETEFFSNYYQRGTDYYKSFFSQCSKDQLKGEFTPHYIWQDKKVIKRIKNHNPNVKLIVSLRDPVERLFSSYQYLKAQGEKQSLVSFEKALEEGLMEDKIKYYEELKRWLERFPRENFLILIFEDIKKKPKDFVQNIYKFLDVDASFKPRKLKQKSNPRGSQCPKLSLLSKITAQVELFFRTHSSNSLIAKFKKTCLFKHCREVLLWIKNRNRETVEGAEKTENYRIEPSLEKELQQKYKQDTEKIENLISRDLNHWKNAER